MSASALQMGLQNFNHTEALLCVLWKMMQSLFVLIILSPLYCLKKKTVKIRTNTAGIPTSPIARAPSSIPVATTPDKVAKASEGTNQRKTDEKAKNKNILIKKAKKDVKAKKSERKKDEQRRDDQTQIEGTADSDEERADIIPMSKVKIMGNIDEVRKERKLEIEKETEEIKSRHEMDNEKPMDMVMGANLHVKIDENKCKLYETNDEPTLDDEGDDMII
ncbi:hypothetical protein X798_00599 [Onchocerca flexuosa]|uniref:Uncharacterized protein n=1 Tax=Onchocerca flexuosa TaxID=387005 RepID=A0A238C4Y3_9BILA|nr:hypothetical protein X798_00599 [Onchocerca flexuosa]